MSSLSHARARAVRQAFCLARALRGDAAWEPGEWSVADLVRAAEHHGVEALLWQALHGGSSAASLLVEALASRVTAEIARAAIRERELAAVLAGFRGQNVPVVVTKGAALAYSCYNQPWHRTRTDTDVLIARDSLPPAGQALAAAGYVPAAAISTGELVSHQIAFARRDEHGLEHVVDVHWKAVNPQALADVVTFDDVRRGAVGVPLRDETMRVPAPEWSLVLACLHRLAHHQDQERLGWLYDIHLLATRLDAEGWRRLCRIALERRVSAICADGLDAAARFFETAVPRHVSEELASAGAHEPSRVYAEREQRRIAVLRNDLRHLPRWRDRARLLREHAFPPASFMMARYAVRRRAWLPAFYVHRLVTGAWKWMRA